MKTRLKCEDPDNIIFTVTLTASAKEWELLRDHLRGGKWAPAVSILADQIDDLLTQARKIYWADAAPDTASARENGG
jgi:hypothetical protein